MFGLPEEQDENVDTQVNLQLEKLNWKRNLRQQIVTESVGASLACLDQYLLRSRARNLFLRKAKQLEDTEGYKSVFISPDRTVEERICRQKLVN